MKKICRLASVLLTTRAVFELGRQQNHFQCNSSSTKICLSDEAQNGFELDLSDGH